MYETYFGLTGRPFQSLHKPGNYYPATSHEQALSQLQQTLQDEESMMLLSSEAGMGKTLLCHCLLQRSQQRCAFLTNSHFADRSALFQAILYELEHPIPNEHEQRLRLTLTDYLLQSWAKEGPLLLMVDEAHLLTEDLLEELRLLGNLESEEGRAIQVVLVGQSSLKEKLDTPQMTSLRQRVSTLAMIHPMELAESMDYVHHRIKVVGGRPESIFTTESLEMLAKAGHGVPRLLNQLAHQSLRLACQAEAETVDAEVILSVCESVGVQIDAHTETNTNEGGMMPLSGDEAIWGEVLPMENETEKRSA